MTHITTLKHLQSLRAKATQGQWAVKLIPHPKARDHVGFRIVANTDLDVPIAICDTQVAPHPVAVMPENSNFIAAAANFDLEALIAHLEEMQQSLDWAIAEIEGKASYGNDGQKSACLKRAKAALSDGGMVGGQHG